MKITIQDARTSVTLQQRDFRVTISGARGPQGDAGIGIAAGGAEGQILAKASATDYDTEWIDNYAVNVEVYVKNSSGSPMTKGQVVYISGADGTNPTISLAIATSEMGSSKTIGWLKQDLTNGAFGYVITEGLIEGINTNAAGAAGDPIWLSPTTAGSVVYGIANKPSAPNHLVFLGYVLRKQTNNGKVYVKVQNGFELGELHDVYNGTKTTPVSADALLLRDSADNNLWKRLTWTNALAGVKSHMDTFKSVAGGYASLDGSGKVPASELPSYVDDVVEVANYAALPGTGETGKIYVTLDTNKCYRWTGSVYVEVSSGGGVDTLTTTGTSGAATLVGSTLNIPQYQGVLTNPVTGTGTAGQVAYFSGTSAVTGSSQFTYNAASRLLTLSGSDHNIYLNQTSTSSASAIIFQENSSNLAFLQYIGSTFVTAARRGLLEIQSNTGVSFRLTGAESARLNSNGRWLLGDTTTDNGQRLQVYGSTLLRGSGTTSATTALLVQNSTPNTIMGCLDSRTTYFGSTSGYDGTVEVNLTGHASRLMKIGTIEITQGAGSDWTGQGIRVDGANRTFIFNVSNSNTSDLSAFTFNGGGISAGTGFSSRTSGTINWLLTNNAGFAPTSGSAVFNQFTLSGTINQTGGANGITRGLYVNPTLTAAADWRSVEWSNNTGWGLYGAGTANNYLGGKLGIGATSLTAVNLYLDRTITGGSTAASFEIKGNVQSDVTNIAIGYSSVIGVQNAVFSINSLRHILIQQGTFGASATVSNQSAFHVNSTLTGATNNYGFYGDIASGTGRWNLYMNGTAANYLAGNTSIGTTTSSGRLTVQGSGTTSATKAFVVNNSTPTAILEILDNGRVNQTIPGASNNTIFGTGAGASASLSGSFNTFYGVNAGVANTTGASNSLNGYNAGAALTTGGSNVYVGSNAGGSNQTATTNTGVGTFVMLNHTTGNDNIVQGFNAARFYADGTTSATSFSLSTYLGAATRVSGAGVTNEIAIGHTAIGNGSNTVTLGNTSITATYLRGNINYTDGGNFVFGTTTGTKIGTATTQKLSFWNATPVAQPTTGIAEAAFVENSGGTAVNVDSTFAGYTIQQIAQALKDIGLLA